MAETAPYLASHSGTAVSIRPGEKLTFIVPADNFTWNPTSGLMDALQLSDLSWLRLNGAKLGSDFTAAYTTASGNAGNVSITLTSLKAANYTNLTIGMQSKSGAVTTTSAPLSVSVTSETYGKINGVSTGAQIGGQWSGALLNGKSISYDQLSSLSIAPGDELLFPLRAGFFTWNGTAPNPDSAVTTSQLRQGKIEVKVSQRKGKVVFAKNSPEIIQENGLAYVRVKFDKDLLMEKDTDFSIVMFFSVDKKRDTGSELFLAGTMQADVETVYDSDGYFDVSDGSIVEADRTVKNIQLYLGNGVSATVSMSSGKRYGGTANYETTAADDAILTKYPAIESVLVLKTLNLNKPTTKVTMDMPGENFYVYDKDLNYLGRSNEKLAYSDKYYLSNQKLTIVADPEDEPEVVAPGAVDIPALGSGNDIPNIMEPTSPIYTNSNENPTTGR